MDDTRNRIRRPRTASNSPVRNHSETIPLHGGSHNKRSGAYAIGSFLVPSRFQIKVRDNSATAKKKFQVNVPTKMLVILGLVFLLLPISVFYYKEKHIHEDHHEPHYKQQKFVNVDQKQAFANFQQNQNNQTSEMTSGDNRDKKTSEKTSLDDPLLEPAQQLPGESVDAGMINSTDLSEGQNAVDRQDNATVTNGENETPSNR